MGILMYDQSVGDRIRVERRRLNMTQQELARKAGVSQATISGLESGRAETSKELPDIASVLGRTTDYLAKGILSDPPNTTGKISPIGAWENESDLESEYVTIPRMDLTASCGHGRVVMNFGEKNQGSAYRKEWFERKKINPRDCGTIDIVGDSMADRIMDGDELVLDIKQTTIKDGQVYAFCMSDEWFVKRFFKLPSGGLRISSDNSNKKMYPDMIVEAEQLNNIVVFGRAIGMSGGL